MVIRGLSYHPVFLLLLLLWLAVTPARADAANRIELVGVTGERKENIKLYLSSIAEAEINSSARFKNRVSSDIKKALRGLGYYQVVVDFIDKKDDNDYILTAKITANKYVYIQTNDLRIYGGAANDTQFLQLLKNAAPKKGERMHHGKYENFKSELMSLANRKGFFDAKFTRTELYVKPGDRRGTVRLYFDSGQRYKFGDISFHGSQITQARLKSLLKFRKGDHYSARLLGELNQSLATTNWFSSINLEADVDNRKNGELPLRIELTPALKNNVEAGVGYETDVAGRLKAKWEKPWLNDRGHSLGADLALSNPEQILETRYKMPLRDVTNDYYQFVLGYKNLDKLDTVSQEYNLLAERNWLLKNGWNRNVSMRWLYEDYLQGTQEATSNLFMPGISFSKGTNSGGSMPQQADYYLVAAEIADQSWGSDTDFIRLRGRAGWIGSWSADERWLLRLDAGTILQESIESIPSSLRFFAGGDNSLRGYQYRTVAPQDAQGLYIGGLHMTVASMEYQHRVKGDWWLALFTDYGSIWNDNPDWQRGVGAGIRWASPIGPVRLDFAFGLDAKPGTDFRIHFTLGPEL